MTPETLVGLTLAVAIVALLYSSVGHAGASGYIAVMSLFGLAPEEIRPTALVLNLLVALVGSWHFWRAGHLSWRILGPFALLSFPMAYLGGGFQLSARSFRGLVGGVLLFSAVRLVWVFRAKPQEATRPIPWPVGLVLGGGLGFLSGLTGTGGGIFLTPLLLFCRWATTAQAAGASVLFIAINSLFGWLGNLHSAHKMPPFAPWMAGAVFLGGALGSYLGSHRLPARGIQLLLALVLTIAGFKLLFL